MSDLTEGGAYKEGAKAAWAGGLTLFGGTVLAMVGLFQSLEGLSAVLNDDLWATKVQYVYEFNVTTWGWIHLVVGVITLVVGLVILTAQTWALKAGIVLAVLSAISHFLFLPYNPSWPMLIVVIDIILIWAFSVMIKEVNRFA